MRIASGGLVVISLAVSSLIYSSSNADAAGRKSCRPNGHMHYGTSDSQPTKKGAQRAAIAAWSSFTEFEYGAAWASYKYARYKSLSCQNKEAGWSCNVEANPCRATRRRTARKQ